MNPLQKLFGASWGTSVFAVLAVIALVPDLMQCFQGGMNWDCVTDVLTKMLLAAGVYIAKQQNVTGGTVAATPEAGRRVGG